MEIVRPVVYAMGMKVYRVAHLGLVDENGVPVGPYNMSRPLNSVYYTVFPLDEDTNADWYNLASDIWDMLTESEDADTYRPAPWNEGIQFREGIHYSAFATRDQALEWFGDDLFTLEDAGFDLLTYEVPDTHTLHGRTQSAFRGSVATLVSIEPLSNCLL